MPTCEVKSKTDDEASILEWASRLGGPRPGQRGPVVVQQSTLKSLLHTDQSIPRAVLSALQASTDATDDSVTAFLRSLYEQGFDVVRVATHQRLAAKKEGAR